MKKIILLIGLFCAVLTMAQNRIYFYFEEGRSVHFNVTKVDSISFVFRKVDGKLPSKFSVSPTKQVLFAQGNLQYQASTDTWRFAENQYDALGENANKQISSTNTGWIDLFGWGTSGYNKKYPYMTSKNDSDYPHYPQKDIAGTDYDWGVYNKISNGGSVAGKWRTLTKEEWEYILNGRANAKKLRSKAKVCNIIGYLLLPDEFECPADIKFTPLSGSYFTNRYSESQWQKLEAAGAVFLPCAGDRNGSDAYSVDSNGNYWTASEGYRMSFDSSDARVGNSIAGTSSHVGRSVRLATE